MAIIPLGPKAPGQLTPTPMKLMPHIDLDWLSGQALSEKYSLFYWCDKAIGPVEWADEAAKLEQNWIGGKPMSLKSLSLSCACALALSGSAWAHHSPANYDVGTVIQVSGTVTEYHFSNPHSWIYMNSIGEDGKSQAWSLESGSTGQLVRRGWSIDSLKPGDEISVYIKPLRSGAYGGLLGVVVMPDGTNLCDLEGAPWPQLGTLATACQ